MSWLSVVMAPKHQWRTEFLDLIIFRIFENCSVSRLRPLSNWTGIHLKCTDDLNWVRTWHQKWRLLLRQKNISLLLTKSCKNIVARSIIYRRHNCSSPCSSFFSISTRRSTPSMTSCTSSTSDLPSLSRLEMSNVPSLLAVSTPPVPLFCSRHFSRMSLNLRIGTEKH